jgi:cytoskeletal protein CcmA (bactofilin family)
MSGIILANKSLVTLSGSATVDGAVIANQIALSGTATITRPPIVSP